MTDEGGERYELDGAVVYFHVTHHPATGEPTIHIDVEHPDLEGIVLAKESTYAGGKAGGLFVGLRPVQHKRAQEFLDGRV